MNANTEYAENTVNRQSQIHGNGSSRRLLAAHGATSAVPKFGSQSVITTAVDKGSRVDVLEELMPLIIEKLRRHGRLADSVTVDGLAVSGLTEGVLTRLADLCQPQAQIDSARATLETVLAAKQGRGILIVARIREAIDQVVEPALATVRERI